VECDWAADLGELMFHWGSAYLISHLNPGVWLAQRRDDRQMVRATNPEKLRQAIRADYAARPVPR
jgi:hypothetical protein